MRPEEGAPVQKRLMREMHNKNVLKHTFSPYTHKYISAVQTAEARSKLSDASTHPTGRNHLKTYDSLLKAPKPASDDSDSVSGTGNESGRGRERHEEDASNGGRPF